MTWRTIISAADSDDLTWTLEQDERNPGRFRIDYGTYGGPRVKTTVDLTARLARRTSADAGRES